MNNHHTTDNRRARWEAAAHAAGREVDRNALRVFMAVADAEQADLRARIATLEHVAAGNKRHVQLIVPDLEQAQAAIKRVQLLHNRLAEETALGSPDDPITRGAAAKRIAAALDGWSPPAAVSSSPPVDRAALRQQFGEVLRRWGLLDEVNDPKAAEEFAVTGLLAVLPSSPTRADTLRWAADALGRMDYDADSNDYGYDTYRDAWNGGVMDGAAELRRLADEAQPDTEAHPPLHRWCVETRDGLADQWTSGSPLGDRQRAVERYEALNRNHPAWKDGTPVERRIVRETTTYTVEESRP